MFNICLCLANRNNINFIVFFYFHTAKFLTYITVLVS